MRRIQLGDAVVSVQGGPWALFLYGGEFAEDGKKANWYEDRERGLVLNDDGTMERDPLFLLKTLWAMAANAAGDGFPSFEDWARPLEIPMGPGAPWVAEVVAAIFAEIFRLGAGDEKQEGGQGEGE